MALIQSGTVQAIGCLLVFCLADKVAHSAGLTGILPETARAVNLVVQADCRQIMQVARGSLASGAADISGAITVTQHSRHKQRLLDLLDPLLKLQEARDLHIGLR